MREHNLRAASTFFDCKNKHNTWRNPRDKCPRQINHSLIPRNQLCYTVNVKRKLDGMDSDHATLCIKFQVPNGTLLCNKKSNNNEEACLRTRIDNFILQNNNKKKFQVRISEFFQNLNPQIVASAPNDDLLILFEKRIIEAKKRSCRTTHHI
jgi:hypothetical protein